MSRSFPLGKNPAFQMAKDKASAEFVATKRVLAAGGHKSSIGSFHARQASAARVVSAGAEATAPVANAPLKK
jgi:hypothetical protein